MPPFVGEVFARVGRGCGLRELELERELVRELRRLSDPFFASDLSLFFFFFFFLFRPSPIVAEERRATTVQRNRERLLRTDKFMFARSTLGRLTARP